MLKPFVLVAACVLASGAARAATTLDADLFCPYETLESCRWSLTLQALRKDGQPMIRINWIKGVISRHMDKPLAKPIVCNVDRDFAHDRGGYLKVWFAGEAKPCDATDMRDPSACGVRFVFEPTTQSKFPIGFEVTAPAGKRLLRVENFNTLNLQCGDFEAPRFVSAHWDSLLGWDASLPGDGTFVKNGAVEMSGPISP